MVKRPYQPVMSDLTVVAKTGRNWRQWFAILDRAGAAELGHKATVGLLGDKYRLGPWWRQMVAVEYERARGIRVRNQTTSGYSFSLSRTLPVGAAALYAATAAPLRRAWFPPGKLKISSLRPGERLNAGWNGGRLEIDFHARGAAKAQIVVQVNRLKSLVDVERERALWKKALDDLATVLG